MDNEIAVLISSYNGEKYIGEQLNSLLEQTNQSFDIFLRDDCSEDNSANLLEDYKGKVFQIESSGNKGVKQSFNELLKYALENTNSDYFMFCDQDDIWQKDKIEKTLSKMKEVEKESLNIPVLIHTDLRVVDKKLNIVDNSFWSYEKINPAINSLNRILMKNTVTGCTVMINRKLAELVLPIPNNSIMHDWWIGTVASYFGRIEYIHDATILYRQHDLNNTGAEEFNLINIIKKAFVLTFINNDMHVIKKNISQARAFLDRYKDLLDKETICMLEEFISILDKNYFQRKIILLKYKLFNQGFLRNIGLLLKV